MSGSSASQETKRGDELSSTDTKINRDSRGGQWAELDGDGDTIVVESGPTAKIVSARVQNTRSEESATPVLSGGESDSIPSSGSRSSQPTLSQSKNTKSGLSGQYSGKRLSIIFSSSTEIAAKKKTMCFLRECGGE